MKKKIKFFNTLILIITCILTKYSYGTVFYSDSSKSINICNNNNSNCEVISVPDELIDDLADSNLSIDTFLGKKYLLLTSKYNSSPNICYSLYLIKENKIETTESNILNDNDASLCQYRKVNHQIISRFRDAGKWNERLYQETNGKYKLLLEDQGIGSDFIQRIIFNNVEPSYKMVSDKEDLYKRVQLTKLIVLNKSYLYTNSNEKSKTKMYLIKGDKVNLLQYKDDFYEVEFTTERNKIIKKWLYCSAIDAC